MPKSMAQRLALLQDDLFKAKAYAAQLKEQNKALKKRYKKASDEAIKYKELSDAFNRQWHASDAVVEQVVEYLDRSKKECEELRQKNESLIRANLLHRTLIGAIGKQPLTQK